MITSEQIQSIVDGECSYEARANLLSSLEPGSEVWRTLALALLEEQEWTRQIAAIRNAQSQGWFSSSDLQNGSQDSLSGTSEQPLVTASSAPSPRFLESFAWGPALAASLLLCLSFFGGWQIAEFFTPVSSKPDVSTIAQPSPEIPFDNNKGYLASSNGINDIVSADMKMVVSGPDSQRTEIPLYDTNEVDPELLVTKDLYEMARINQNLRRQGYELDVRPEFFTGKLNDGRQLVVPVKHVGLKPYGL